jgi:group I intron endonuclease
MLIMPIVTTDQSQILLNNNTNNKRYFTQSSINSLLYKFLTENKLDPVYIYENLQFNYIKQTILESLKGLSGVYLIFNNLTGDYYIGSAATGKFHSRFYNHLISFRGSKVVKNAVRKYGIENFSFVILELFTEIVNKENNKKLLDLEDFYLKSLLPNYNILTEAGSSFGYKHTELSRVKMKTNYSQARKDSIGNLNKGKKLSEETINKIREKALMKNKPILSEEALNNMRKKSKAIRVYNLNRTVFGEYSSIVEASRNLNCCEKTIIRALRTKSKMLKRRFIVEYKNK